MIQIGEMVMIPDSPPMDVLDEGRGFDVIYMIRSLYFDQINNTESIGSYSEIISQK
jgi:hypothetical protein